MSKWLVQLLCVVTCLVPLSSSFAAPQQKPTRSKSVGADVDKKWEELEDKVEKYRKLRVEASCQVAETLAKTLLKLDSEINGRKFAQEVLGFQNIHQAFGNQAQIRQFVQRSFKKHVVDIDEVEQALVRFLKEHDAKMAEIDNQFLVECQLDVEFDPAAIRQPRFQLDGVRQELGRLSANLDQTVSQAFTHHLVAGGAGLIGGEIGNTIGNEMGRDSNGNATAEGQLMGLLFGIAAGMIAEEIASKSMGTEDDVASKAAAAGHGIIRNHLIPRKDFCPTWLASFSENVQLHDQLCLEVLKQVLGPQPHRDSKSGKN